MILFQMYVLSLLPQTQRLLTSMMHLEQLTFCITVKTSMAEKWHCL